MRRLQGAGSGVALLVALVPVAGACDLMGTAEPPPTLPDTATTEVVSDELPGPEPEPIVLTGDGRSTAQVRVGEPGPLVATARFQEKGPVSVVARGAAAEILLFHGRAPFSARRGAWSVDAGLFSVRVRAPGGWRIVLRQPRPDPARDAQLTGEFSGNGFDTRPVRVADVEPTEVRVDYRGGGRFGLFLIPYERFGQPIQIVEGAQGPMRGRFPVRAPASEPYLLQVDATGPWRLTFR